MIVRSLLFLLGVFLALPLAALVMLAMALPITISGIGYLLGCSLAVSGLIIAPWGGKYSSILVGVGLILLALVAGARLAMARTDQPAVLRLISLPHGKGTRWINTVIDEQDSLIFGEAIFHRIGGDSPREHKGLASALHAAYSEIRAAQRIVPSPVLSTYLNLQQPDSFDAVIVEPESMRHPDVAVIFLHGYMGNVTVQCWEIAQAVRKFGVVTICPSTDWTGQWWTPKGKAILQGTIQHLREQGIQNFYLGGFSNGAFGISRLASELGKERGLRGLFFINGLSNGLDIQETRLPVLIIQGAQDERVPATMVRPMAATLGEQATYVELEGDHFMIIKQPAQVQETLAAWLGNQEYIK